MDVVRGIPGWLLLLILGSVFLAVASGLAWRRGRPRALLRLGLREKVVFGQTLAKDDELPRLVRLVTLLLLACVTVTFLRMPMLVRVSRVVWMGAGVLALVAIFVVIPRERIDIAMETAKARQSRLL